MKPLQPQNQLSEVHKNQLAEITPDQVQKLSKKEVIDSKIDLDYMSDLQSALLIQKPTTGKLILLFISLLFVSALIWAHFSVVDEVTVAQAKVIPASREQLIQSLEGGILESISVREGSIVKKGQELLVIDATRAEALYKETRSRIDALEAQAARFRAEANQTELKFPASLDNAPDIKQVEMDAYLSRKRALDDSLAALQTSYQLITQELQLSEPLSNRGLMSSVEILRMKRQANDIKLQLIDKKNQFTSTASAELSRVESELGQLKENARAKQDVVTRSTIRSPVDGIVTSINITTIGGVVPQGGQIMQIVPTGDELLLEAKVKPADMAFLRLGAPATVKISAYDYAIYGGLDGYVEHISSDTIEEKNSNEQRKGIDTYYKVLVRTNKAYLEQGNKQFEIIPGMTATVQIKTGQKSILDYILKPVLKAREAFRER